MKKWFVLLISFLLLVGCGKKEDTPTLQTDTNNYKIASPYKQNVGGYSLRSYDKDNVITMLTKISKKYFKINNSIYEEGQYLSSLEIKELLSKDKLNSVEDKFKKELEPTFITTIYEQNYLATNGHLKGISLAIVLDNEQNYMKDNINRTKTFDVLEVLEWGKTKAQELIEYMRSKEELKNVKIVVGLYVANHGSLPGNFTYVLEVDNKLVWNHLGYEYRWMDSNLVMEQDIANFNNVLALKNNLQTYQDISLTAYGLYQQTSLEELFITIRGKLNTSTILSIGSVLQENLSSISSTIPIHISFKTSDIMKGYMEKKANSLELEIYLLEG